MTGLVLVGGGKMGGALLAGWLAGGEVEPGKVTVVEPHQETAAELRRRHGVAVVDDVAGLDDAVRPDAVVFAVKPQALDAVAPLYRRFATPETLFLSIAAGKTLTYLEAQVGSLASVVRSMPNTPAAIGRGITVACPNGRVSNDQRLRCTRLLEAVGTVEWIDDESLMDAVTAVSGSGPAYVFLLIEALGTAGTAAGLPAALSERLARATICGAAELAWCSDEPAATLRRNVTSPQGTTAAALDVLMARKDGLEPLLERAVAAAAARSRELAKA